MVIHDSLKQLFNSYNEERETVIDEEQFAFFVMFFPALLIIVSDQVIDMEEWEYIKQLAHFMAKSFREDHHEDEDIEELSKAYLSEICYMLKHQRVWKDDYLNALQKYLKDQPSFKVSVLDTMMLFAEASEGTSEEEESQIEKLKAQLDL